MTSSTRSFSGSESILKSRWIISRRNWSRCAGKQSQQPCLSLWRSQDSNQATYQSRRHMNDNSLLIKEINDLRREVLRPFSRSSMLTRCAAQIKNLKAANGRIVADMNFKALGSSPAKPAKPQRPQSAAVSRMGVSSGNFLLLICFTVLLIFVQCEDLASYDFSMTHSTVF